MEELFATKIVINKLLNIEGFEIPLSETERKHLIITGKNGSGKTTLLNDLKNFFNLITTGISISPSNIEVDYIKKWKKKVNINGDIFDVSVNGNVARIAYNLGIDGNTMLISEDFKLNSIAHLNLEEKIKKNFLSGNFIIAFFEAKRHKSLKVPTGATQVDFKQFYEIEDNAGHEFIQYLTNLKIEEAFAKIDNKLAIASKINSWFDSFAANLLQLFDIENAELVFDSKYYNFNVVEKNKPPYNLNQLSDGYSAMLDILGELIMRSKNMQVQSYDMQGIVLIDEIETHLHIELQKKILPFLTSFFPRIQFIVTTHSPFVISSVSNAVICDLEKRIVETDFSAYSYDAIVENYFDVDKYSEEIKKDVAQYGLLMSKENLNSEEQLRLNKLNPYMIKLQNIASDELAVKIQQIRLKNLNKKEA